MALSLRLRGSGRTRSPYLGRHLCPCRRQLIAPRSAVGGERDNVTLELAACSSAISNRIDEMTRSVKHAFWLPAAILANVALTLAACTHNPAQQRRPFVTDLARRRPAPRNNAIAGRPRCAKLWKCLPSQPFRRGRQNRQSTLTTWYPCGAAHAIDSGSPTKSRQFSSSSSLSQAPLRNAAQLRRTS